MSDRRKATRLDIRLKIGYKLPLGRKMIIETFSENVSGKGIRVTLNKKLHKGDRLKTLIYFPKEPKPVTSFSEVVWCKARRLEGRQIFDSGLRYVKISPRDRERFVFLFCELMINYFMIQIPKKQKYE